MTVTLVPNGRQQFLDANGSPIVGGTVGMYIPGTLTPKTTWQDSAGVTPNTNPITLDALGSAAIWGDGGYRQIVKDSSGNVIWDVVTTAPALGTGVVEVVFGTLAIAEATPVAVGISSIILLGYSSPGDGGGGQYALSVGPAAPGKFQSADGQWWVLGLQPIYVEMFGAKGDGVTNDATSFLNAATFLSPKGGIINLSHGKKYYLTSVDLSGFNGITIEGDFPGPDVFNLGNNYDFSQMGCLLVDKTASLSFGPKSGIKNLAVIRSDLAFPEPDSSGYSGTPLIGAGTGAFAFNCIVIGFGTAWTSSGFGRILLDYFYWDCITGPSIDNSADTSIIDHFHGWPYGTFEAYQLARAAGGTAAANAYRLQRAGQGIRLSGGNDNTVIGTGLVFGYLYNYYCESPTVSFNNIWSDNTGFYTGSIGVYLNTGCDHLHISNLASYNCDNNILISIGSGAVDINQADCNVGTSNQCTINAGYVTIGSLRSQGSTNGSSLTINGVGAFVKVDNLIDFGNNFAEPVSIDLTGVSTNNLQIGRLITDKTIGTSVNGNNPFIIQGISFNSTLALPLGGNTYRVNGGGTISIINGGHGAREVYLYFDTNTTLATGGNIQTGATVTAGAYVLLKYNDDESLWRIMAVA